MSSVEILTESIVVKIDGRELSEQQRDHLVSVAVEQTWSAADRIELSFVEREDIGITADIGATIEASISNASNGSTQQLFKGELTAIGYQWAYGEDTVVLEGYDARHKLTRTLNPTTYQNIKFGDVISTIAGRHGLTSTVPSTLSSTTYSSWMVAASDFAILQQISLLTGFPWRLVDGAIEFNDPSAATAPVTLGAAQLIELELRATPIERGKEVEVHGWDTKRHEAIVGKATRPTSPHTPADGLKAAKHLDQKTAVSWRNGPVDAANADQLAKGIGHRMNAAEIVGRGMTRGNAAIVPGASVRIEGVSSRANGTYRVSDARHVYGAATGSLRTSFRIGSTDAALADLLRGGGAMPGQSSLTHGVTIGIVTDVNVRGGDVEPGRVRVKLPFIGDQVESGWARVMSQGGGKDRGIAFVPEVGDEVLVAFEHGDLNRPYVLGTVWGDSGKVLTDLIDNGKVRERSIVSRIGNKITFVDEDKGASKVGIAIEVDDAKSRLFFGKEETTLETTKRPMELRNGKASIKLDKDEITITANKITITSATGDVTVEGQNVKVTGKMNVDVAANNMASLKAKSMLTVESSGMTNVKGATVQVN